MCVWLEAEEQALSSVLHSVNLLRIPRPRLSPAGRMWCHPTSTLHPWVARAVASWCAAVAMLSPSAAAY